MRHRRASSAARRAPLLLLGLLGALLTAGSTLLTARPAAAQAAQPVVVTMGERGAAYFFDPNEITVPAGTVHLTFKNDGTRRHNWVVEALGVRIPDVTNGTSYDATFTFDTPGTYDFLCDLPTHAARGMVGHLTVTAAGAGSAPAQGGQPTAAGAAATRPAGTAAPGAQTGQAAATPARPGAGQATTAAGPSPGGLPTFVSLAIHIPAAISWLGVVLYQALVCAVPYLTPGQRADLLQRPRWVVLGALPLFLATGIYQTIFNPFVTITDFGALEHFRETSTYGTALFWKHGFVTLSVACTLLVTFWLAPRLATAAAVARTIGGKTVAVDPAGGPAGAQGSRGGGESGPPGESAGGGAPDLTRLVASANVAACLALLICVAVIVFQLH